MILLSVLTVISAVPVKENLRNENVRNDALFRLPTTVYPRHYNLTLRLDRNFGPDQIFSGTVSILLNVTSQVSSISIHSSDITINGNISLTCGGNETNLFGNVTNAPDYEMIYINTTEPLNASSECVLQFENFTGILADDMFGFYRSYYLDENNDTV